MPTEIAGDKSSPVATKRQRAHPRNPPDRNQVLGIGHVPDLNLPWFLVPGASRHESLAIRRKCQRQHAFIDRCAQGGRRGYKDIRLAGEKPKLSSKSQLKNGQPGKEDEERHQHRQPCLELGQGHGADETLGQGLGGW